MLISAKTFSGAEHFSYDLKMLKRATLVGETTGGRRRFWDLSSDRRSLRNGHSRNESDQSLLNDRLGGDGR